jgi:hypothetical protein
MEKKKKAPKAPPSRSEEFKKYKKKMGMADNVEMRHLMKSHPMNAERTGPSTLKEDPVYKKSGGKIYNCR